MSAAPDCRIERRREDVRRSPLLGIEYVETGASPTTLEVHFLGKAPAAIDAGNVLVEGGLPVTVTTLVMHRDADPAIDDWMEVRLAAPGDASPYTLSLVAAADDPAPMPGFDPRFASAPFSFAAGCPSDLDCCVPRDCPPPARPAIGIDYLAKDFDSLRRLLLDRLAVTMPGWSETHLPDIGVALVDLLAYAGDQLSYFQDAVATEAYLGTARLRTSLRRHARLVDYRVHEGCNARAWVTISCDADTTIDLANTAFCTSPPGAPAGSRLAPADIDAAPPGSVEWFEPLWPARSGDFALRAAHDAIAFHAWGDGACCLPAGSTSATLRDAWAPTEDELAADRPRVLDLRVGDVLILEEVLGPRTGLAADADPTHRQAVRLTRVEPAIDPLYEAEAGGVPVLEVAWCPEDALRFPLCLSAVMPAPDCGIREGISVARGNVLLVDSGRRAGQELGPVPVSSTRVSCASDCAPVRECITPPRRVRLCLDGAPLTFAQALAGCCASSMTSQDPRRALPELTLEAPAPGSGAVAWAPVPDLLASGPDDRVFVVEIDDAGRAHLRFGDDRAGHRPGGGTTFAAHVRWGNGPDGNVGAESITRLVALQPVVDPVRLVVRNPLAATGGTVPEAPAEVRMLAPTAARARLERAIVLADYEALLADNARRLAERGPDRCGEPFEPLQGARAAMRWNGTWNEIAIALDPYAREAIDDALAREVDDYLAPYRRIGHDLRAGAAAYVALDVGLCVCVAPHVHRATVKAALLALLGTGLLPDGRLGAFHPDRLRFGDGVAASPIIAIAQAVPGVVEVRLTRLARLVPGTPAPVATDADVPASGMLALRAGEIARLDNDPARPSNGRLTLLLRGGR